MFYVVARVLQMILRVLGCSKCFARVLLDSFYSVSRVLLGGCYSVLCGC